MQIGPFHTATIYFILLGYYYYWCFEKHVNVRAGQSGLYFEYFRYDQGVMLRKLQSNVKHQFKKELW